MRTPALFKEYIWMVNTIRQARRITLSELNRKWVQTEMSGGVEMARSTFNRHKDAIEDIFGIIIDCDRRGGYRYYIGNDHVLSEESIQNWMLSSLSVHNLVSESLSLQQRILLEPVPSAGEHLECVISAMKQKRLVSMDYRKYSSAEARTFSLAPYCIKLFHRRWYLLGRFDSGKYGVFSLDRVCHMEVSDEVFELDAAFNAEQFFSECYGVVTGDGSQAQRIVIRAFGTESNYLRDLPLHHSQREVGRGEGYTDFEYVLRPTLDLQGQILSRGSRLKVLQPQSLADSICRTLDDMRAQYDR